MKLRDFITKKKPKSTPIKVLQRQVLWLTSLSSSFQLEIPAVLSFVFIYTTSESIPLCKLQDNTIIKS